MRYLLIAAVLSVPALLLAAGVRTEPSRVDQWTKAELVGYIKGPDDLQLFGTGRKELDIVITLNRWSYHYSLVFACEADYKTCENLINQAVVMQAYEVRDADHRSYLMRSVAPLRVISEDERPEIDALEDTTKKVPQVYRDHIILPGDIVIPAGD
jgi:hypothetical protein